MAGRGGKAHGGLVDGRGFLDMCCRWLMMLRQT